LERTQAEQSQEQLRGPVQDGAELRAARLFDHSAFEQCRRRGLGVDAADPGDLWARNRLQVGDDRERLGLRRRQWWRAWARQQPSGRGLGIRMTAERPATRELAQQQAAALELVVLPQP